MNGKWTKKKYDINDFSFGLVATISAPYEKYSEELGTNIMVHNLSDREYTMLLHEENKIIDLKDPNRKFYIPRDEEEKNSIVETPLGEDCQALGLTISTRSSEEKSSVVEYEFPLGEYCQAAGLPISTCTPKKTLQIVKKYAYFFEYYTPILRANKKLNQETKRGR